MELWLEGVSLSHGFANAALIVVSASETDAWLKRLLRGSFNAQA